MYTPLTPFQFTDADLGRLNDSVGPTERNRPDDVAKIETALDRLGYFTVDRNQGPSGIYHSELKDSLIGYQADRDLIQDGTVTPNGPTLQLLGQQIAEDPGPNEVDDSAPLGPPPGDEHHAPSAPSRPATGDEALDKAAESVLDQIKRQIRRGGGGGGAGSAEWNPKINPKGFPRRRPLN